MNAYQLHTDAFIIRIWREAREITNTPARWRGVVESVGSSERVFFENFKQMLDFIGERIWPEAVEALNDQIRGTEEG